MTAEAYCQNGRFRDLTQKTSVKPGADPCGRNTPGRASSTLCELVGPPFTDMRQGYEGLAIITGAATSTFAPLRRGGRMTMPTEHSYPAHEGAWTQPDQGYPSAPAGYAPTQTGFPPQHQGYSVQSEYSPTNLLRTMRGTRTSEFFLTLIVAVVLIIATYADSRDSLTVRWGWLYITLVVIAYTLSRGMAKLGRAVSEDRRGPRA